VGDEEEKTETQTAPGGTPPGAPPAGGTPPAPGGATPSPANAKPPAATPPGETSEKPGEGEGKPATVSMPSAELKDRLSRERQAGQSAVLKKLGVESEDDLAAKLKRLAEIEAQDEEKRRAALAESDRLKEDLAKEKQRADEAVAKLQRTKESQVIRNEAARVARLGSKHVDPSMLKYAVPEFGTHLASLTNAEIKALDDKGIEKWFADFAKRNPKFARPKTNGPTNQPPATKRVPATNTATPGASRGAAPPAGGAPQKTAKPGQPNTMSGSELRKATGLSLPWIRD